MEQVQGQPNPNACLNTMIPYDNDTILYPIPYPILYNMNYIYHLRMQLHLNFGTAYNQSKVDEGYIDDMDFPEPYRKCLF